MEISPNGLSGTIDPVWIVLPDCKPDKLNILEGLWFM